MINETSIIAKNLKVFEIIQTYLSVILRNGSEQWGLGRLYHIEHLT